MSAKIFGPLSAIPQMDLQVQATENGGLEGTQTFLFRKSAIVAGIGTGELALFQRGSRWEEVYPEVPSLWRNLTIKTVGEGQDHAPGILAAKVTFTGYAYAIAGSSPHPDGDDEQEPVVPTTSLRGNLEEVGIDQHEKFLALSKNEQLTLGKIQSGLWHWIEDPFTPGNYTVANEDSQGWNVRTNPAEKITSEDGKVFAGLIAKGRGTYKQGGWMYNYRIESSFPFRPEALKLLGKIVRNPPGSPTKPPGDWTWLLIGPDQSQSGPDRFVKDLSFQLIPDNDETKFLYEVPAS